MTAEFSTGTCSTDVLEGTVVRAATSVDGQAERGDGGVEQESGQDATMSSLKPQTSVSAQVAAYQRQAQAENTRVAYSRDWAAWRSWCTAMGQVAMPAEPVTVAEYVAEKARAVTQEGRPVYAPATLSRWVAAINHHHGTRGLTAPGSAQVVRQTLAGIRRNRARQASSSRGSGRARPLMLADLKRTLAAIDTMTWPTGAAGTRDAALLLVGWAGALRRSELAALTLNDVRWHPGDGLIITIPVSKTDQDGTGQRVGIPRGKHVTTCGPCAVIHWADLIAAAEQDRPRVAMMQVLRRLQPDRHICLTPPGASASQDAPDGKGAAKAPADGITLAEAYQMDGPLLRTITKAGAVGGAVSGDAVGKVVARRTRAAGLRGQWSAHSLRVGLVTEASRKGATPEMIQRQTRHRSAAMVAAYTRLENVLENNAVTLVDL